MRFSPCSQGFSRCRTLRPSARRCPTKQERMSPPRLSLTAEHAEDAERQEILFVSARQERTDCHFTVAPPRLPPDFRHQVTSNQCFIANWVRLCRKPTPQIGPARRRPNGPKEGPIVQKTSLPNLGLSITEGLPAFLTGYRLPPTGGRGAAAKLGLSRNRGPPVAWPLIPAPCRWPSATGLLKRRYGPKTPNVGNEIGHILKKLDLPGRNTTARPSGHGPRRD